MPDKAQAVFEYAGVPLLLDTDRQAQRFLDRYLPIEQMVSPPTNTAHEDWHGNTYGQGRAGLPRFNYPPPPQTRINTLWWPTGAVRWARGWFLVDQDGVDTLIDPGNDDGPWADGKAVAKTLRLSTPSLGVPEDPNAMPPEPYVLEAEMHMLRPIRVTATADEDFGDLWILPLVDQRYWWQFRNAGDLTDHLETWDDLIAAVGTQLGVTIEVTEAAAAYMIPDRIELDRSSDNAAVVLDAIAASIGRRVVVGYDGTVSLDLYTKSRTTLQDGLKDIREGATAYMALQGGTNATEDPPSAHPWPDSVTVAFQRVEDPADAGADTFWESEVTHETTPAALLAESLVATADTTKTVHCSAWAMFQCGGSTTEPANKSNLDALAEQYADDYYGWLLHIYDYSWPGVQRWTPCGYDDAILYEIGTEYVSGLEAIAEEVDDAPPDVHVRERLARRYLTRVQSMPANFGVSSLLCQYENAIPGVADDLVLKTPTDGIPAAAAGLDAKTYYGKACCTVYTEGVDSYGDVIRSDDPVFCDDAGTPWQVACWNIAGAVEGDKYIATSLLKTGRRYAIVVPCE